MRVALTCVAGISAVVVCMLLARYPAKRVALPVVAYLLALGFSGVLLGLVRMAGADAFSRAYTSAYQWTGIVLAAFEIGVAGAYVTQWLDGFALLDSLCFAAGIAAFVWLNVPHQTAIIRWVAVLTGVELGCGLFALLSLVRSTGSVETLLKCGLGAYWVLDSSQNIAFIFERVNPHLKFVTKYSWLPDAIALVCMVLLIVALMRGQGELARQGTNQAMQQERTLAEVEP